MKPAVAASLSSAPRLLRLAAQEARIAEQLAAASERSFEMANGTWSFRWLPDPFCPLAALLHMRVGSARLAVGLSDLGPFPYLAGLVEQRAPVSLIAACVEIMGAPVWDLVAEHGGGRPDLLGFEVPGAAADLGCRAGFVIRETDSSTEMRGVVCLYDPAAFALALSIAAAGGWQLADETLADAAWLELDLPVPLVVEVGRTRLAAAELRQLRPGDAVLVDQATRTAGSWWLSAGTSPVVLGRCSVMGERLRIDILQSREQENIMNASDDPDENAAAMDAAVGQLQVELRFELARWHTTVAEIRQLRSGTTLELMKPVDGESVSLWVGSQCIGKGRIVAVGDQLAVQLLQRAEGRADGVPSGPRTLSNGHRSADGMPKQRA